MSIHKNLIFTSLAIAVGIILPFAFHMIPNGGRIFLPMHIPVLLCGLICSWKFGIICGIITPLLSSLFTGMPNMAVLPSMLIELAVYGLMTGIFTSVLNIKNRYLNILFSLIGAMICGRIVAGLMNSILFQVGSYSAQIWISSSFITAIPGIIIQISVIPALVFSLEKAKIVPAMR